MIRAIYIIIYNYVPLSINRRTYTISSKQLDVASIYSQVQINNFFYLNKIISKLYHEFINYWSGFVTVNEKNKNKTYKTPTLSSLELSKEMTETNAIWQSY